MRYFLAKTDPDTYSLDQFEKDQETIWDGVHNFQAIACIKSWQIGDKVLIYHSQQDKAIVGLAEVIGKPFENKNDARPSWAAKLKFIKRLTKPVTLAEIKSSGLFSDFLLVKNPRLSTMSCPDHLIKWLKI